MKCLYCGIRELKLRNTRVVRFCSSVCFGKFSAKPFILKKGYKRIHLPDHHRADSKGYVREHLVIMEKHLKRKLKKDEVVHHIDRNPLNNEVSNLMLFPNNAEHIRFHRSNKF